MSSSQRILSVMGFPKAHYIENRASVADLFKPSHRCGIYVLHFKNDEYYVGQAVDVTRRYVQHFKNHTDICEISFREVQGEQLNDIEREMIGKFERQDIPLRNIALTSFPKGESDFDLIMSENDQAKWLSDVHYIDWEGKRPIEPQLRKKYQRHFERFMQKQHAVEAIEILQDYVRKTIPAAIRGEISFWGCSCLPSLSNQQMSVYSRINIYWQEVFTIYEIDHDLAFSWHLARTPLEKAFGSGLMLMRIKYPLLHVSNHHYKPGGSDQLNLEITGTASARKILNDKNILNAMRVFNYRLMKKGPCTFGRNHCLALADEVLGV